MKDKKTLPYIVADDPESDTYGFVGHIPLDELAAILAFCDFARLNEAEKIKLRFGSTKAYSEFEISEFSLRRMAQAAVKAVKEFDKT